MVARVSMLLKSRASPDLLPFSLCNKKKLAAPHMNRPLFPTTLSIPSYDIGKQVGLRSYQHPLIIRQNHDVQWIRNHLVTLNFLTRGGYHVTTSSGISQVHKNNPDQSACVQNHYKSQSAMISWPLPCCRLGYSKKTHVAWYLSIIPTVTLIALPDDSVDVLTCARKNTNKIFLVKNLSSIFKNVKFQCIYQ